MIEFANNPFQSIKISNFSKLKHFADNNFKFDEAGK